MSALVFVDTNVLVYERDTRDARKQEAARAWMEHAWESRTGRLSVQVLTEFYATVTRKLKPGMAPAAAQKHARALAAWRPVALDLLLLENAWEQQARYQAAFWDALIVAAAKTARCRYLLSEDFQAGQDFDGLEVVSPFAATPEALG